MQTGNLTTQTVPFDEAEDTAKQEGNSEARAAQLFREQQEKIFKRTDRLFGGLMLFQWLAGIVLALVVSPRSWSGQVSQTHIHVWLAIFLGGIITGLPAALALRQPGRTITRHVIAAGQMLMGALLIHLTGGRIETHFHVFGSLAFLAFYRDWRVLITASFVVAVDHYVRGVYWPYSVFRVLQPESWRWLEHAAWVVFEDIFLIYACRQSMSEMRAIAERQAQLEAMRDKTELTVQERTQELKLEIAERKQAEEALSVSEVRFRSLVQSANDGIILANWQGNIISWNMGARHMFGFSEEEVLNKPMSVIMPHRYREGHRQGLARFQATGESQVIGKTVELHGRKKNGTEFPIELSLSTWKTSEGTLFSGIVRDITERKQAEGKLARQTKDLARSNAELEQFAYVASHDLQEPLRMVANYTQLLARRYKDHLDATAHEFIGFAVDGATRMQRLINDLLEYSRVGTRGKEFIATDCARVLGDALANLRGAVEAAGAVVTSDNLPTVKGDAGQLLQLFQNLIGNALKFQGQAAPRVHITASRLESDWLFAFKDNGIGIDPQYAERIFIIFQRLHGPLEYPGTGIGLSICKKIVERHGGRIWVESELGQGATFCFSIPVRDEPKIDEHTH